jgi:SET domain-containing protein
VAQVCRDTGDVLSQHIVLCALKAIPPGEELTYDYQLRGDGALACKCGAAVCRGVVNSSP